VNLLQTIVKLGAAPGGHPVGRIASVSMLERRRARRDRHLGNMAGNRVVAKTMDRGRVEQLPRRRRIAVRVDCPAAFTQTGRPLGTPEFVAEIEKSTSCCSLAVREAVLLSRSQTPDNLNLHSWRRQKKGASSVYPRIHPHGLQATEHRQ
jgi:hypothetical protein